MRLKHVCMYVPIRSDNAIDVLSERTTICQRKNDIHRRNGKNANNILQPCGLQQKKKKNKRKTELCNNSCCWHLMDENFILGHASLKGEKLIAQPFHAYTAFCPIERLAYLITLKRQQQLVS